MKPHRFVYRYSEGIGPTDWSRNGWRGVIYLDDGGSSPRVVWWHSRGMDWYVKR